MKINAIASVMCMVAVLAASAIAAEKQPIVDVHGNTIVAFFPPVSDAEMERDADLNEALSDFQHYAERARKPLERAGVDFRQVYAHSFRLRIGTSVTTFHPLKVGVGYYFVAPGKKPRVKYGVMTDADLLDVATHYFGTSVR